MSRLSLAVLLLVVWVLLWGAASPANLLSGLAVIGVLFVVVPSTRRKWPSHAASPVGIVRLAASFANHDGEIVELGRAGREGNRRIRASDELACAVARILDQLGALGADQP